MRSWADPVGCFGRFTGGVLEGRFAALRAGEVEDELSRVGVFFLIDGGKGAQELAGDVGEDGGATGGDFVLGEEEQETGEEVVDLGGGGEVVEFGGEGGAGSGGVGAMVWQV